MTNQHDESVRHATLILDAAAAGKTAEEIAAEFSIPFTRVRALLRGLGIRYSNPRLGKMRARVVELFDAGVPWAAIAAEVERGEYYCRQIVIEERGSSKRDAGRRPENAERNRQIIEEYKAGASSIALGEKYNLSRERVCQFLRKENVIAMKYERIKMAREALQEEKDAMRAALRREREARVAQVLALVEAGESVNRAIKKIGAEGLPGIWNHPALRNKSRHGRHRDFGNRVRRFIELREQGVGVSRTIAIMRAEGELINPSWVHRHIPEKYLGQKRKPRLYATTNTAFGKQEWAGSARLQGRFAVPTSGVS